MFRRLFSCLIPSLPASLAASLFSLALLALFAAPDALAQQRIPATMPDKQVRFPCGAGFVDNQHFSPLLQQARFIPADIQKSQLSLTFVGHSTFLIESPAGVKAITDYNDYYRAKILPDIATMNIARGNHSTDIIDPSISHVLRGWSMTDGKPPKHDIIMKDLRVYNLPTNLTETGGSYWDSSSMFIFQSHGLCVGHMGHLRHILDQKAFSKLGRMDVMLVPVDRRVTQSYKELMHNLKGINPRLIIPMHYNGMFTIQGFLERAKEVYPVKRTASTKIILDRQKLPLKTEILVMTAEDGGDGSQF